MGKNTLPSYSPYTYVCTCIQLTLEHGPGGRINKYRYTRVASGLPRICCGNSYTADPGTRCGGGRIIKYLTVIQELHAVYPVFVVAPYMLLTLVRGVGGWIIKYLTVTYTRVGSGLPLICFCALYTADPGTRSGWYGNYI